MLLGLALPLGLGVAASQSSAASGLPPHFIDQFIAAVTRPTDLAFTPDGRWLVTQQTGQVLIFESESNTPGLALDLSARMCTNGERGLASVAVDPDFETNHFVYLYYTYNKHDACPLFELENPTSPVNRLARFTLLPDSTILSSTEVVLIDNIPQLNGLHNAGDINFGADGWLYVSVGDGGKGSNARDLSNLSGKILRIKPDGTVPVDNPYVGTASQRCGDPAGSPGGSEPCQEIFAHGLRNPFRFAIREGTNTFFINDVGATLWEEIDLGQKGADYGWNVREGPCPFSLQPDCPSADPASYVDPVYYYHHSTGCYAITAAAFVPPGVWPPEYDDAYLFGDYGCGRIWRLIPGTPYRTADFASGLGNGSLVSMVFGSYGTTQALYYVTYADGGQLRRIAYTHQGNLPPMAMATAEPAYGASLPLAVTLSAAGSLDPNVSDPLVFDWDFGDGTGLIGTPSVTTTHVYIAAGVYTATLLARDAQGAISTPATVRIDAGNTPPLPSITWLSPEGPFVVGASLQWQGTAVDQQDGDLAASSLTWEAWLHHVDASFPANAHVHPQLAPTVGGAVSLLGPEPEDFGATSVSFIELRLTATDAWGLSGTITEAIQPQRVPLRFEANWPSAELVLNGLARRAPFEVTGWQGASIEAVVPLQTDALGQRLAFDAWVDSPLLMATRTITTPASPMTYTAQLALTTTAPVPTLTQIAPAAWPMSGAPFTLTVSGMNFAGDAVIRFDGVNQPTTFVSNAKLETVVMPNQLRRGGLTLIRVFNPAPGGGQSKALAFVGPRVVYLPWLLNLGRDAEVWLSHTRSQHEPSGRVGVAGSSRKLPTGVTLAMLLLAVVWLVKPWRSQQ